MKPTPLRARDAEMLTVEEFAELIGRTPRYVAKGIRAGRLPGYWDGDRTYDIPRLAVERFLRGDWRPAGTIIRAPRTKRRAA